MDDHVSHPSYILMYNKSINYRYSNEFLTSGHDYCAKGMLSTTIESMLCFNLLSNTLYFVGVHSYAKQRNTPS